MALVQDVANQSIRQAIATLAEAVDRIQPTDTKAVGDLSAAVDALKTEVKALNVAINGEPAQPPVDQPAPTAPVL